MSSFSNDSNGSHPINRFVLSVVVVELGIGTLTIVLRTYTKFRLTPASCPWPWIWALLSWAGGVFDSVAMFLSIANGLGVNASLLTPNAVIQAAKWSWVSNATTRIAGSFGRIAVVAFILELKKRTARPWVKVFLWSLAISNLLFNTCIIFFMFLRCTPAAYVWDRKIPGGTCPLQKADQYLGYAFAAWGGFSDFLLAIYPISIFWDLQMGRCLKIGISMLMGMGILACACAVVLVYQIRAVGVSGDLSYRLVRLAVWSSTEMWVILIASSAAPLWPLVRKLPFLQRRRVSVSSESPMAISSSDPSHTSSPQSDAETLTCDRPGSENNIESDGEKDKTPV